MDTLGCVLGIKDLNYGELGKKIISQSLPYILRGNVAKHMILSRIGWLVKDRKTRIVSTTYKLLPKEKMVISYIYIYIHTHTYT